VEQFHSLNYKNINTMNKGILRFETFLQQFEKILSKAASQKNPALYLYQNNSRTPLFMLEGLAKLYSGIHNQKKFTKLKEHFKLLEDALGAIDYYDSIAKDLSNNKKVPLKITQYLQAQTREKLQHLNEIVNEKKWISESNERLVKIRKKLTEANWLVDEKEVDELNLFYGKAIYEIIEFTHSTNYHFDNMEQDVHELRRKLRWLSIYPQALQGCVQLTNSKTKTKQFAKYLTREIINSPFNMMPNAGENQYVLMLNKDNFLALSWLIAALGELKDSGLTIVAIKEALQQIQGLDEAEANNKAYQILGNKQIKLQVLLDNAEEICKTFFDEKNLENLVIGTKKLN